MRSVTRATLSTGAVLMCVAAAAAQAPVPARPAVLITEVPPPTPGPARSFLAVMERLASFDVNKDRTISRNELPERMQELVARGDTNTDGALDSNEIRALVTTASAQRVSVSSRPQPFEGLPGVIKDLRLAPGKHERALAILATHPPAGPANGPTGSDLYRKMKALLDDEEYENFVAAATRLTRSPRFVIDH